MFKEESTSVRPPTAAGISPPSLPGSAAPSSRRCVCPMPSLDQKGRHRDAEGRAMARTQAAGARGREASGRSSARSKAEAEARVGVVFII